MMGDSLMIGRVHASPVRERASVGNLAGPSERDREILTCEAAENCSASSSSSGSKCSPLAERVEGGLVLKC